MTFTSVRPDCFTASAAPGTAGEEIAMISLTSGWTLQERLRLVERLLAGRRRSGRMSTSSMSGYFSAQRASMCFDPLVQVGGGQRGR